MKGTSFQKSQLKANSPEDLAKVLGHGGVQNLLKIMCKAYRRLYISGKIKCTMSEPEISEELYIELLLEWKKSDASFIPTCEKAHGKRKKGAGKTPTIDICFRKYWSSVSYFGFECKRLKEKDSTLYKNYVEKGMRHFLLGEYSPNCSVGSMIGYITVGNIGTIINDVKNRVDKESAVSNMKKSYPLNDFTYHHVSAHKRKFGYSSPFYFHHLFFTFI